MKSAVQLVFLVLYAVSSYGTTQARIVDSVNEVRHAAAGNETVVHDVCQQPFRHTNFREAKKAGMEYTSCVSATPDFFPLAGIRRLIPRTVSFGLQFSVETSTPRAPPA